MSIDTKSRAQFFRALPWLLTFGLGAYVVVDSDREVATSLEDVRDSTGSPMQVAPNEVVGLRPSDIRSIVREELARSNAPGAALTAAPPAATEEALVRAAESAEASTSARALISSALSRRTWTPEDKVAMRHLIGQMSEDDLRQTLSALFSSINRGEIVLQTGGAIL